MKLFKYFLCSLLVLLTFQASAQNPLKSLEVSARPILPTNNNNNTEPAPGSRAFDTSCTILSGDFDWLRLQLVFTVLSTFKIEESCNRTSFQNLSMASIKAQLRTIKSPGITVRGGIHSNLMDVNLSPIQDQFYLIGNLKFSSIGRVKMKLSDLIKFKIFTFEKLMATTYTPFEFESDIYYIWNIGTLAHQLVGPNGQKYIMMGYTNDVSPHLTREGLNELWSQLALPNGWRYESLILNKTITIRSSVIEGIANDVLFDELSNFYISYKD